MKRFFSSAVFFVALLSSPWAAQAHFGMLIPSRPGGIMEAGDATIRLDLKFWHPFANNGMDMEKPVAFQVFHDGKSSDLLSFLKEGREQGKRVWSAEYTLKRPGLYAFVVDPAPYFEKAEDCFIIHHTKVYVDAFGLDEGWDRPLGLKAEIVPMVKPDALYAGKSVFTAASELITPY